MKLTLATCLFALLLSGALIGATASRSQQYEEEKAQSEKPETQWIAAARGIVEPISGLMSLAAQREGLVAEVMVEEGDHVTAGQILARLEDSAAHLQLRIADTEVQYAEIQENLARLRNKNAEATLKRLLPLGSADAVPQREITAARHNADIAAAELLAARHSVEIVRQRRKAQEQEIDAHTLRAPVDGIIVRRIARPGHGTSTSTVTKMFLLAPDGPRVLKAQLDELFVGLVQPGQKCEILQERDNGTLIHGTVIRVAPIFYDTDDNADTDDNTRTLEVIIRLEEPEELVKNLVLGQRMLAKIKK